MQVTVNDIAYEVPFDLMSISLGDFIAYREEYGQHLDKALSSLLEKKYEDADEEANELNKANDFEVHLDNEALAWICFWTKHDPGEIKKQPGFILFTQQFRLFRHLLKDEESELHAYPLTVSWNGEDWSIQDFKVNPASDMSFNEIITSKEIMRQVYSIGKGNWEGLPYLCGIYFRKKEEPFSDELIEDGGERMELLKTLPLKYALQVAFFLSCCVSIWSKTLASSAEEDQAAIPSLN